MAFNLLDMVQLKSGGRAMAVTERDQDGVTWAGWFDQMEQDGALVQVWRAAGFPTDDLEPATTDMIHGLTGEAMVLTPTGFVRKES